MASLTPPPKFQFVTTSGPVSLGKLYTYAAGSDTPLATYTDADAGTENANPVVLDANGSANVWLGSSLYKLVLKTSLDTTIWTVDKVGGGVSLSDLSGTNSGQGAFLVGFKQSGGGAVSRTVMAKAREVVSVLDFGAVGDGATDDTAAFNLAVETGKRVFVPAGTYKVTDVAVVEGLNIYGERGELATGGTVLLVGTNSTAAFRHSAATAIQDVRISDLTIRPNTGVTGAKAYRQNDKSVYLAYASFNNVETDQGLSIAYDGFFIFCNWNDCRDGYIGTTPALQDHYFISSIPATFGQANQTNLNQLARCNLFRSTSGAPAAIDIAYGSNWYFEACDFESLACQAIRARGIFDGKLHNCWFEVVAAAQMVTLGDSPAPSPQGSRPWSFDGIYADLASTTGHFINNSGNTFVSVVNSAFVTIPSACYLVSTPTFVVEQNNNYALSGAGLSAFFTDIPALRSNIEFTTSVVNSPQSLNQNVLPIGPVGLGQANFTNNGYTSLADVASGIGLAENAVRFTCAGVGGAAYYTMPARLVTYLQGKTITVAGTAYTSGGAGEAFTAAVWDSVTTPAFDNATASGSVSVSIADAALQTTYVTYTVGGGATSLKLGFFSGGSGSGQTVSLESMRTILGKTKPNTAGLK